MNQINVSLDDELRQLLTEAAKANGRSIGKEIRERLRTSFADDLDDPTTRELATALGSLAAHVAGDRGVWHRSKVAAEAFAAALSQRIVEYAPDYKFGLAASVLFSGDPETAGRMIERYERNLNSKKKYPLLAQHQQDRAKGVMTRAAKHIRKKGGPK